MTIPIVSPIIGIFWNSKLKIFACFASFMVFIYLLFPFNDLGDYVSTQIAKVSNQQVNVTFDNLDMSLIPNPGLKMSKVMVDAAGIPPLNAESLVIAPNIAGLLAFKPGVSALASGIFGGEISLSTRGGDLTKSGVRKQKLNIGMDAVAIKELLKMAQLDVPIDGRMVLDLNMDVDPSFADQPAAKLSVQSKDFQVKEGSAQIQGASYAVPPFDLKNLSLEGTLEKGVLTINKANLGGLTGDLSLSATGRMIIKLVAGPGGMVTPMFEGYDLNIKLQLQEAGKRKLDSYLSLLNMFKVNDTAYSIHLDAPNLYAFPNMKKGD